MARRESSLIWFIPKILGLREVECHLPFCECGWSSGFTYYANGEDNPIPLPYMLKSKLFDIFAPIHWGGGDIKLKTSFLRQLTLAFCGTSFLIQHFVFNRHSCTLHTIQKISVGHHTRPRTVQNGVCQPLWLSSSSPNSGFPNYCVHKILLFVTAIFHVFLKNIW